MIKKGIILVLNILITIVVTGNDWNISLDQGLSDYEVIDVLQDDIGYIWIATADGLNCYDGYEMKSYRHDPEDKFSLFKNRISSLTLDKDGNVWAGTRSGVSIFNIKQERFFTIKCEAVSTIAKGPDGNMYIGAISGAIYKVQYDEISYEQAIVDVNIELVERINHFVTHLVFDGDHLWVGSKVHGLYLYKYFFTDNEIVKKRLPELKEIRGLYKDDWGRILCTSSEGTYQFRINKGLVTKNRMQLNPSAVLKTIKQDSQGVFYALDMGNNINRINVYEDHIDVVEEVVTYSNVISNFIVDRSGIVWYGTRLNGLFRKDSQKNPFVKLELNGHDEDVCQYITAMYEDSYSNIWIAVKGETRNGFQLVKYNTRDNTQRVYNRKNSGFNISQITSITEDSKHNIWFTGQGFSFCLKGGKEKSSDEPFYVYKTIDKGTDYSFSIAEDHYNNYWLGTWNGVFWINGAKDYLQDYIYFFESSVEHAQISSSETTKCYSDPVDSVMWIGTKGGGLNCVRYGSYGQDYQVSYFLKSNDVWDMKRIGQTLWVGTSNGLYQVDLDSKGNQVSIKNYSHENGFPGKKVTSLITSDPNTLWLTTDNGLVKFEVNTGKFLTFDKTSGLSSNYLTSLQYCSRTNQLFIGTVNGIDVVNPDSINLNNIPPQTYITELIVNGESFEVLAQEKGESTYNPALIDKVRFDHTQKSIELKFNGFHYLDPLQNKFVYKLEGVDDDWIYADASNRSAKYANLAPGKYKFLVCACNSVGVWDESSAILEIVIMHPPWLSWWAYLLYAMAIVLLILLFTRYSVVKVSDKYKLQMQQTILQKERELNEAKLQFFTNISHELRTPLTLINAPFTDLVNQFNEDEAILKRLKPIQHNVRRLMVLINQLLEFRKIETGNLVLKVVKDDVVAFIRDIKTSFDDLAVQKNIHYRFETNLESHNTWLDFDKLDKILYNLISNAMKFTPDNGAISLMCNISHDKLSITVKDTGIGIPPRKLKHIFKNYYQVDDTHGGTGIGLSLTKSLVELHKGEISVTSTEGEGTVFCLNLPLGKSLYRSHIVSTVEQKINREEQYTPDAAKSIVLAREDHSNNEQLPIVLVVEDEPDIRDYLKSVLSEQYQVCTASNGEEGLEKAIKFIPDLIMSDILMPKMNGYELCEKLKANIKTSHIPIVFLTAMSTEENELNGLKLGAQEYIPKPFNPNILRQKITNMIDILQRQKSYIKKLSITEPEKLTLPSREDEFLQRVIKVVEENLSNNQFEVTNLCAEIGLSRMQLHRKLKAICGQSAVELIRSYRFKRAAQLLETSGMNVSEVMWEVGIESTSHFSRTFKSIYGMSPSVYMKEKRNEINKVLEIP
ncbi:response regulator [Puteibacter caeruleilacunae]|nr:response regulator [Puteibacter caeruleilacunae]